MIRATLPIRINNGVRSVDLSNSLSALAMLNVTGFYNDADYYGIKLWIDAYMRLENAPMPSSVGFKSPCATELVSFPQLCSDLADEWIMSESECELHGISPEIWNEISDDVSDFTIDSAQLSEFSYNNAFLPDIFDTVGDNGDYVDIVEDIEEIEDV